MLNCNSKLLNFSFCILNSLDISVIHKTCVPAVPYYHMVQNLYAYNFTCLHKPLGYGYVLAAWRRVSAWMVMYKDNSCCRFFYCILKRLPRMNERICKRPLGNPAIPEYPVFCIKHSAKKDFLFKSLTSG